MALGFLLLSVGNPPAVAAQCLNSAANAAEVLPFQQSVEQRLLDSVSYRLSPATRGWVELEVVSLSPLHRAPTVQLQREDCRPLRWRSFGPLHRVFVEGGEDVLVTLRAEGAIDYRLLATMLPEIEGRRGVLASANGTGTGSGNGGGVNEEDPDDPGLWSPELSSEVARQAARGVLTAANGSGSGSGNGGGVNEEDPDDPGLWSPELSSEVARQAARGVLTAANGSGSGSGNGGGVNEEDPDDPGLWSPELSSEVARQAARGVLTAANGSGSGSGNGGGVNEEDPDDPGLWSPELSSEVARQAARGVLTAANGSGSGSGNGGGVNEEDPDDPGLWSPELSAEVRRLSSLSQPSLGVLTAANGSGSGSGNGGGVNEEDPDDPGLWSPGFSSEITRQASRGALASANGTGSGSGTGGVNEEDPDDPGLADPGQWLLFLADPASFVSGANSAGNGTGGGVNEEDPDDPGLWSAELSREAAQRFTLGALVSATGSGTGTGGVNEEDPDDPGLWSPEWSPELDPHCLQKPALDQSTDEGITSQRLACATGAGMLASGSSLESWRGQTRRSWVITLPEHRVVRWTIEGSSASVVRLFDLHGALLREASAHPAASLTLPLPAGMYFLEIEALAPSVDVRGQVELAALAGREVLPLPWVVEHGAEHAWSVSSTLVEVPPGHRVEAVLPAQQGQRAEIHDASGALLGFASAGEQLVASGGHPGPYRLYLSGPAAELQLTTQLEP
ncbi:MAG: hypothetical protein AAGD01_17595 [Acidobacteriota bacterium]